METTGIIEREQDILNKVLDILKKYLNPDKIILFGSRAKGSFCKNSDFDLAIDTEKLDTREQRRLMEKIDAVIGLYKVDIIYLNSIEETFKNIILKTGKVIYERRS